MGGGGIEIASFAKYLGVYVGPGRAQMSWQAPLSKYLERARIWGNMGVGALLTCQAYQVFIGSVLMFVGQLEALPDDFGDWERQACRALFPGPARWIAPSCLKELRTLGFATELKDITSTTVVAKARVLRFEASGELAVRSRAWDLRMMVHTCSIGTLARCTWLRTWADRCFYTSWSMQTTR